MSSAPLATQPSQPPTPSESAASPGLIDALPIMLWSIDPLGQPTYLNRALLDFFRASPEQMAGDAWRALIHPDDLPRLLEVLLPALAARTAYEVDCRALRHDGVYRWLQVSGAPTREAGGAFVGFSGLALDITSRKETERRLEAEIAERRRAQQASLAQQNALIRTLSGLAANPRLDAYLDEVLKALANQLDVASVGLWLVDDDDRLRLRMDYEGGRTLRDEEIEHPGAGPLAPHGRKLRELVHKPRVFDVAQDPVVEPFRAYFAERGVLAVLIVPMYFGQQLIGAFSVRGTRRRTFRDDEIEMAQALAQQATLAIELTRLAEKELKSGEALRRTLQARVAVQNADLLQAVDALHAEVLERQRAELVSRGQTEALARTLELLTAEPALDTFLGQVLCTITEQLDAPTSSFWFYDSAQDAFEIHFTCRSGQITRGRPPDAGLETPTRIDRSYPDFNTMLHTRRPVVQEDVPNHPRVQPVRDWLMRNGVLSVMLVPVIAGADVLGMIIIHNARSKRWLPGEVELAQALARLVSLAAQLTRLAEQGSQSAVLEERNRMAREIHDTLAQTFTGIVIHQEAAKRLLPDAVVEAVPGADPAREESALKSIRMHVARTLELARGGLTEARRSVGRLRSRMLDGGAPEARDQLPASLARLVDQMTAGTSVRGETVLLGKQRDLPAEVRGELLRIGQEAVTNAVRHAAPKRVCVELAFAPDSVRLRVWDDGVGFNTDAPRPARIEGGFGLTGMHERAERLGGRLLVTSQPLGGTEVIVSVKA